MVSQVSLECELFLTPENLGKKDGDSNVPPSSQDPAAPQMPAKKQTRQWAAWTRQEEESFFSALRQVGKNFEKITSRVQSKNKDQVRHYYYRLVRRMNKLLGPELCLDAKNSKDTNAAMLRWWSLLEKYSCKASKLHLKPRRFKIFIETLESQLLKDRKKNIRRRPIGENTSSVAQAPASNQVRASGHDNRAVKMVLLDGQNIQKVGNGKGSLVKRHVNAGMNRSNCKVEPTSGKIAKQRRKTGLASTAAYKRWEKAAIAGVSLVADAAEHLERADTDKEIEHVQETPGQDGPRRAPEAVSPLPEASLSMLKETNINNYTKLKLQLFPIDECTRKVLEMDNRNPHLELTLSTRKKISSVLEHLNRKWGNSSFLSQELILFPYWAHRDNVVGSQKWTKDSPLCAADVYYSIGSPPTFRLRYGWFSKAEIESATSQALSCTGVNQQVLNRDVAKEQNAEIRDHSGANDQLFTAEQMTTLSPSSRCPIKTVNCSGSVSSFGTSRFHNSNIDVSSTRRELGALAVPRQVENTNNNVLSAGDWADSLTNISMGDLLSESSQNLEVNCAESPIPVGSNSFQPIPFSCDSFDAAIAAHIYKHQNNVDLQQGLTSNGPSIWDADETCDAFAFQKMGAFGDQCQSASRNDSRDACKLTATNPSSDKEVEELPEDVNLSNMNPTCEDLMDSSTSVGAPENSTKDFNGLTDIYWPDSLGPLDLDIPSCRYHSDDVILSDSLGGLSRLIANSLDAFQNCSFFGLDKKETAPTAEPRQTASFPDFQISSEV